VKKPDKIEGFFKMKMFVLCFVPFFLAVDAIGVLPIYLGLKDGISQTSVSS
jgi:hypothetical protein